MASQADRVDEAEEDSTDRWLLGLRQSDFTELPELTDVATQLFYQQSHENSNRERFGPSTQQAAESSYIDPNIVEQFPNQVHATDFELGDFLEIHTDADDTFAPPERDARQERQAIIEQAQQANVAAAILQNEQGERKCLKCRYEKGKCDHQTRYHPALLPAILAAYSMLSVTIDVIHSLCALYRWIIPSASSPQRELRFDHNTVLLYMVFDSTPPAELRDVHSVVFFPDKLRRVQQIDAYRHDTAIEPAIGVFEFDQFISSAIWPDHEQQPAPRLTQAQKNTLQTSRLFCGYLLLLANLDQIQISTEYTEQNIARKISFGLLYFCTCRLSQLYQQLGIDLQGLVGLDESNHYVVARTLELIYKRLRASIPVGWDNTHHPISQQLHNMRVSLNEWLRTIMEDIRDMERNFASRFRGDGRLMNDPTMRAAENLGLPGRLQITFRLFSPTSITPLPSDWSRMATVPELLSSEDIYIIPPADQPVSDVYQPDPTSDPSLPLNLDLGELSSGTSTDWTLQPWWPRSTHDPDL